MAYSDEVRFSDEGRPKQTLQELQGKEFDLFPNQPPKQIDTLIEENDNKDFYELEHQGPWTGKGHLLNFLQSIIARPVNGNWENKISIDDILSMTRRTPQEEKTLLDSLSNHTNTLVPEVGSLRYKENIKK